MKNHNNRLLIVMFLTASCIITGFAGADVFSRLQELLRQYTNNIPQEKVYVFTDKNSYRPGERIWFSAYLKRKHQDNNADVKGNIILLDHNGAVSIEQKLRLNRGQGNGYLSLPKSLKEGVYFVGAFTDKSLIDSVSSDFYRQIIVREKFIPGFILQADLKKDIYQPGKKVSINLRFLDPFNEPVGKVHFRTDLFDAGRLIWSETYRSEKKSQTLLSFTLPAHIISDEVDLLIFATGKSFTEHLYITIPVKSQGVYVQFFPEGGRLIAGVTSRLAYKIYDMYGNPIRISGKVVNANNLTVVNLKSNMYGTGFVDFIPYSGQQYFFQITKPAYLAGKRVPLPETAKSGIALSLNDMDNGRATFSIRPVGINSSSTLFLTSKSEDDLYWSKKIESNKPALVEVPGKGLSDFAVFDEQGGLVSERLFFTDDRDLIINLSTDRNTYPTRGETTLIIRTTDRAGRPVPANVALSITDHIRSAPGLTGPDIHSYFEVFSNLEKPYPSWSWGSDEPEPYDERDLSINTSTLEKYNWRDILSKRPHTTVMHPKIIRKDQMFLYGDFETFYSYRNYTGNNYYIASNPGLVEMQKKGKKFPYYKRLLENGTPLREVIMVMRPYNLINGGIVFYGLQNSINFQDGALIILDEQKLGTKATLLDDISPYTIETIRISTLPIDIHEYTAFNSVGIIELKSKGGQQEEKKEKDKSIFDDTNQTDTVFISPRYKKHKKYNRIRKDYRTTLFWDPNIQTDENGIAIISYNNSDIRTTVNVTAEGITATGHTSTARISYEVK